MITNAQKIMTTTIGQAPASKAFALNDGDCGLVIRKDGKVEVFQQGFDIAGLQKSHSLMSQEDLQALLNGQSLMALSIVAGSPDLQQTILSVAVCEGVATVPAANANG